MGHRMTETSPAYQTFTDTGKSVESNGIKVGLVCPYNIFLGGGVQEVVAALQRGLTDSGHVAKIITPLPWGNYINTPSDVIFLGTAASLKSPFHTTAQVSVSLKVDEIDDMLEREQFDILHFHEPWVPIMSRQLLSRSASYNVATFHAKLPETIMSRTIERVITPYTKSILRYLTALIAVSEPAADYVRSLSDKHVAIIPNGIDLKRYKMVKPKPTSRKTILYIGRLEKRKGLKYLLKAFGRLADSQKDIRLIIAGDGPDRAKHEEYAKTHHIKGVSFVGYVSEKQKLALLRKADLFCSPAAYGESFGIVLLEAMATGTVIVAGNNSGYASVLTGRGALSLVNPKDIPEFARRLDLLLRDDELRKVWRNWASSYVRQFDYPKVVAQHEAVYKKVLLG